MHDALGSQVALSAVVVFLLQMAKKWDKLKWINTQSATVNRILAVLLAGLTAAGVHWAYDTNFSWAAGGNIIVTWPGISAFAHGGWEWLQSFSVQEWMYRSSVNS